MPVITCLERQKHIKERLSVYVDGEYAFSVCDDIAIEYGIAVGADVTRIDLEQMMADDENKRALSCAFKHISVSEKSEKQVRDHLTKKGFSQGAISKALSRLKELSYVDDLSLAQSFVEHSRSSGIHALRYKLIQKGIPKDIIDSVLLTLTDDGQLEKAISIIKIQLPRYSKYDEFEKKKRLNAFLLRKGFSWEIAEQAIDRALSEGEEE
jgi:regulatory protein